MIKKHTYKFAFIVLLVTSMLVSSCTDNQRAKNFGGTQEVKLGPNEKFVNITWKNNSLWVIVQDTTTGIFYAKERSSFGLIQGQVIIK